ncbi:unnamed protein product [Allacma fusca]|uniref:C2H2-type domain-containing protein n=1 Tax=Allacma fusca TaxID=39272 RepID=A0A8J2M184_9HEXA|nr:unnamed protein product [Allacma fusca]
MTKASAKILLSEPLKSKKLDAGVQPWKNFGKKYTRQKVSFCRNVTLQRYLPVVPVERPKGPGVSDGVPQEQELGVIEKAGHFNFEGTSSGINVCIDEVGEDVNMPAVIGSEGQDAPPEEFRLFLTDNEADIHGDVVNEHAQEDTSLGSAAGNSNQESTDFYSKYHSNSAGVSTISIWNPYADLKTEVDLHDYTHNSEDSSANGMEQTGNPDADYTFTSGLSEGDNYISDDKTSSVSSAKEDDGTQKRRKKHKFVQLSDTKFEYRGFTFELENGRFKCNHCSYNGNSKSGINSHIITYHIDGDGKSRRIRSNIRYVEVSKNHFKFGDNHSYSVVDGRYLCGHCPLRSVSGENVRQHIRRYHMGMDLSSKTKISESSDLEYNYTKVGDEYKCGECGFLAKQDVTIRGHFRHKHFYNRSKHVCKICL